jgi:hypothetical protein
VAAALAGHAQEPVAVPHRYLLVEPGEATPRYWHVVDAESDDVLHRHRWGTQPVELWAAVRCDVPYRELVQLALYAKAGERLVTTTDPAIAEAQLDELAHRFRGDVVEAMPARQRDSLTAADRLIVAAGPDGIAVLLQDRRSTIESARRLEALGRPVHLLGTGPSDDADEDDPLRMAPS